MCLLEAATTQGCHLGYAETLICIFVKCFLIALILVRVITDL